MARVSDLFSKILKGGAILFLGSILQSGLNFLMRAYLAQKLGTEAYGVATAGISGLVIVSMVVLLGIHRGIGRYLPRTDIPAERRSIVFSAMQTVVPLGVGIGVLVVVFSESVAMVLFHDSALSPVVAVFGAAIPFVVLVYVAIGVVQGFQKSMPKLLIQNLTLPVTVFLGVLFAVEFQYGVYGVGVAHLLGYVLAAVLGLYYIFQFVPLRSEGHADPVRRELLVFSLPLVAVAAIRIFFLDLDVLMLSVLTTRSNVGIYGGVFPLVKMFGIFLASFSFLVMPIFSELDLNQDYDQMHELYRVVSKWILIFTLPLALSMVLFPKVVLGLTFGQEYTVGANALRVLAVAYFTHAVVGPNSNSLISLGHTRTLMFDNIAAAAANALLNLVLIPEFAFLGAAIATALSYVGRNVLVSYHLYRYTSIHPLSKGLLKPCFAGVAVGTGIAIGSRWITAAPLHSFAVFLVSFGVCFTLVVVTLGDIGSHEVVLLRNFGDRFGMDVSWLVRYVGGTEK